MRSRLAAAALWVSLLFSTCTKNLPTTIYSVQKNTWENIGETMFPEYIPMPRDWMLVQYIEELQVLLEAR